MYDLENSSGDCHPLFLSPTKLLPLFADPGLVTVWECVDDPLVDVGSFGCHLHFLLACIWPSVVDVVAGYKTNKNGRLHAGSTTDSFGHNDTRKEVENREETLDTLSLHFLVHNSNEIHFFENFFKSGELKLTS